MIARTAKVLGAVVGIPVAVAAVVIASPFLFVLFLARFFGHLWHVTSLRAAWPSGKFVLVAYTDSELWAPYIENELLPQIERHAVVINRSREDWKRQFRAEQGALAFWGGWRCYNPIAIVLRPWGRVRVFRFYEPFRQLKHGEPAPLETLTGELVACVRGIERAFAPRVTS